ncbi:hypothetical protein CsSME_00046050 [Camellia sinensis var. sinensis]
MNPWDGSNNDDLREMLNQMAVQMQQENNWTFLQACQYATEWYEKHMAKTPCRTSILTGHAWICELYAGHMGRFEENVYMAKEVFAALCETLVNDFGLQVRQCPHGLAVEESVAMFIHVLQRMQNRQIQERFQHSGETVSRHLHNVLTSMKEFTVVHCRPTYNQHRIHLYVRSKYKYLPFKDCIGAIDGTHVSAWVMGPDAATYFGSMHDSRTFYEILTNNNVPFPHPEEGKYYLVDSGYPNRIGYLAPFKGSRYHQ